MDIEITGLEEIEADFLRVSDAKTLERNVARAAKVAMEPVKLEAIADAPVDDGDLRRSITISSRKMKNGNRSVRVGPDTKSVVRIGDDGAIDFSKKKRPANYAHLVELGTEHSAAQPFLRPAFDKHAEAIPKVFGEEMKKGLNRVMKKAGIS